MPDPVSGAAKPGEGAAAAAVTAAPAVATTAAAGTEAAPAAAAAGTEVGFQPKPSLMTQAAEAAPAAEAKAVADKAAADKVVAEKAAAEKPAGDKPADAKADDAAGKAAADKAAADKAAGEAAAADKSAAEKTAAEAKAAADKVEAEKAAKPVPFVYEPFKAPEGVALAAEQVTAFTSILNDAALSPQDRAQRLVDLYAAEAANFAKTTRQAQIDAFGKLQQKWIDVFVADPELGGARQETTLAETYRIIQEFGGTKDQQNELFKQLDYTGLGNNIGLIRLLTNIYRRVGEPTPITPNPPRTTPGNRADKWYGKNGAGS